MAKILCPAHKDTNPSCEVYEDYLHCFVCGYRAKRDNAEIVIPRKQPADIKKELEYIDGLTKQEIRGLLLPADEKGYYIVWPDRSYYKKRLYSGKSRYIAPAGHKAPLFKISGSGDSLVVVEGELNALSIVLATNLTIVSSGSATELNKCITTCLLYSTVFVIVDKDIPGVINGLKLKEELLHLGKRVYLIAKEKDYNQILQEEGTGGVKEALRQDLGVSGGMRDSGDTLPSSRKINTQPKQKSSV